MSSELTQNEIKYLLNLEKNYVGVQKFKYPTLGGRLNIQLTSADKNEDFILDITRSHISLSKNTFQKLSLQDLLSKQVRSSDSSRVTSSRRLTRTCVRSMMRSIR